MSTPRILVGSSDLGWQEFGDVAVLGTMTRAMPGGDGSLEFTLTGKAAGERRNVLRERAEVILDTGDDQWGGLIVGDPMAGYYAAQPVVSVAAAGLWSHAANRRDVAWVWCDSDPTRWFRIRQYFDDVSGEMVDYIDQGKFAIDTEGRLMIRADADRNFHEGSYATLGYWLAQGLVDSGCRIVGVDISYKSQMPADWMAEVKSFLGSPWSAADDFGNVEWADGATRAAWTSHDVDLEAPSRSLLLSLNDFAGVAGSPAVDPFVKARTVVVRCRMDGAAVDRAVTLDKAMCDLATLPGLATVTRSETLGESRDQLAIRPEFEKSVADGLRELAALHGVPVEHYFDRAGGAWRFTCNEVPEAVDPTRNRHWIIDDKRPGEGTSGVVRDPEAAPEYLRVTYLSSNVASVPDGQPRSYCYPSDPGNGIQFIDANIIPAMSSATAPSGVASASSVLAVGYEEWKAFNHSLATEEDTWYAGYGVGVGQLQYQFPAAHVVTRYAISVWLPGFAPKSWTFEGSNDGSSWVALDTQTNITDWSSRRVFDFVNEAAYAYCRLDITAANDVHYLNVGELEMMESIQSPAFLANVSVYTDQADVKLTDAQAADVAARLHEQMSVAAFSGSATLPVTALTVAGQELPSRLMRPGDRVNIMGREGATDLYVSETSYDWPSGQMSVTVGWPFEIVANKR